jgi:hypothetical protein
MGLTITGLTSGDIYSFQFWSQSGGSTTATAGNAVTVGGGGNGQFAIGTFTADATTQAISFSAGGAPMASNCGCSRR